VTTDENAVQRVVLGPEDRYRMERLHEELIGRLHEMAAITARNLRIPLQGGYHVQFRPDAGTGTGDATQAGRAVAARYEIVCSDENGCGYYDTVNGVCERC